MFIRWKKSKDRYSASLVKSVRKDGKPRQKIIANLVSMEFNARGGLIAWAHLEMKVPGLALSEQDQAQVYHLFAQKVPRPPDEMLAKTKQEIAALLATIQQKEPPVVPDTPPTRPNVALQENESQVITWAMKIDFHHHVFYTASLLREEKVLELGTIGQRYDDREWARRQFWLGTHNALCLADVGTQVYKNTMQMLETWIEPLPPETMLKEIRWQNYYAEDQATKELRALYRRLDKLEAKRSEIRSIRSREEKYLTFLCVVAKNSTRE